jgi:hypothetical protein
MELVLNIAWALLTVLMAVLWMRFGLREGVSRRTQIVALVALVLILFPVISVSDDLQTLQNPAEADSSVRRDHVVANDHSLLPALVSLVQPIAAEQRFGVFRVVAPGDPAVPVKDDPALAAIDNRPPPAA